MSDQCKKLILDLLNTANSYEVPFEVYEEYKCNSEFPKLKLAKLAHYDEEKRILKFSEKHLKLIGVRFKEENVPFDFEKVTKLLKAYNEVRNTYYSKKLGITVDFIPFNPNNVTCYNNVISFLESNSITDWYLYMYTLYTATNWSFVFNIKNMHTEKALEMYKNYKNKALNELTQSSNMINTIEKSRWLDVFDHIEEKKQRFVKRNQEEICFARQEDFLGYHPKSTICTNCRLKVNCAVNLLEHFKTVSKSSVDILQLRNGSLSKDEANRIMALEGSSFEL